MPDDAPLRWEVVREDAKGLRATFALRNRREESRWFVLRSHLHEPIAPRLTAHLFQLARFADGPHYLQALGVSGGWLAFRLAPGASLEVSGFAFRSMGPPAVEVWEVRSIQAGGRPAEEVFGPGLEIAGDVRVAGDRSTQATEKGLEVELDVVERWELPT